MIWGHKANYPLSQPGENQKMLEALSDGFREAKLKFSGKTTLSEDNVQEAISAIRESLLEADVEYGVAKSFINKVKEEALGQIIRTKAGTGREKVKVSPADHFVKICQNELENFEMTERTKER